MESCYNATNPFNPPSGGMMRRVYCTMISIALLLGFAVSLSARQDAPPPKAKTSQNEPSEIDVYRKAVQINEPAEKVAALKKFLGDFPQARLKPLALMQLFKAMID